MPNHVASSEFVMTVLEAHVPVERADALRRANETARREAPPQLRASYLVQSTTDPTLWRMVSIWESRDALAAYRQSVEVPGGVAAFREVGVDPMLMVFEGAAEYQRPG
jgi:quinol monooxygenase YgiN